MTATTPTLGTRREAATLGHIGRLARGARAFLSSVGTRWSDFVDAGQLGPSAETMTGRHTGARI